MPRTASKATVNNFVGGLVSDFHELNQPPNTTVDENNCDLDRRGSRLRRLGMDFESGYVPGSHTIDTATKWPTAYSKAYEWNSVGNNGSLSFKVIQTGALLTFYDMNSATLSAGEKTFSVDLGTFRAPAYYDVSPYGIQVASGKGALFVVGEAINPFYILYDSATDTISTHIINIRIRDMQLQDPDEDYTDGPLTLTPQQQYDRYNQGWYVSASVDSTKTPNEGIQPVMPWYVRITGHYPPKTKSWWLGKILNPSRGIENFQPENYDEVYVGNMLAPLGTYILDAFAKDRSAASGIDGLPVEIENARPTSVAFSAGRVFYGHQNRVFFSQVLDDGSLDFSRAGNCFQEADPTSEKISDIVATDGGVIPMPDAGTITAMMPFQNSVFCFSFFGVWAIGGNAIGGGFAATDFSTYKVTDEGLYSPRTLISVGGAPCWWSRLGIFMLISDPAKQGYSTSNILDKKLQLFYNNIPATSKLRATGTFDRTKKVITWLYNATGNTIGNNPFVGDTILNFDTILQAFYKYTLSYIPGPTNSPYVTDVFNVFDLVVAETSDNVVDVIGNVVTDNSSANVTVLVPSPVSAGNLTSSVKYLTYYQAP